MRSHSLRETPGFWFWFELTNRSIETHLKESAEERDESNRPPVARFPALIRGGWTKFRMATLTKRISQSVANAASVGHRVENIAAFVNNASHQRHLKARKILVHVLAQANTLNN
jgi:hypothetical protein